MTLHERLQTGLIGLSAFAAVGFALLPLAGALTFERPPAYHIVLAHRSGGFENLTYTNICVAPEAYNAVQPKYEP